MVQQEKKYRFKEMECCWEKWTLDLEGALTPWDSGGAVFIAQSLFVSNL